MDAGPRPLLDAHGSWGALRRRAPRAPRCRAQEVQRYHTGRDWSLRPPRRVRLEPRQAPKAHRRAGLGPRRTTQRPPRCAGLGPRHSPQARRRTSQRPPHHVSLAPRRAPEVLRLGWLPSPDVHGPSARNGLKGKSFIVCDPLQLVQIVTRELRTLVFFFFCLCNNRLDPNSTYLMKFASCAIIYCVLSFLAPCFCNSEI